MIHQSLFPYLCDNSSNQNDSFVFYIPPKEQQSTEKNVVVSIIGEQFTDQTITYLVEYFQGNLTTEPRLGSILLDLILCKKQRSYGVFILLIHANVKTSDLNNISEDRQYRLPDFLIQKISLNQLNCVYTICSHFKPCHNLISEIKHFRHMYKSFTPIVELQHGWLVGKRNCLRDEENNATNPDIYLVIDKPSQVYLRKFYPSVKVIDVGDVLFSKQILAYSNTKLQVHTSGTALESKSKTVLVCFSEKDCHLGYISGNLLKIGSNWFPKEVKPFLIFLARIYSSVSLTRRSKPHQDKKNLHKYFDYETDQPSLIQSLICSDFVISALSTVSISAALCGIPSAFYISKPRATHQYMIKSYMKNVFYIDPGATDDSYKTFFGNNIEEKFNWLRLSYTERLDHLLCYAESAILKFDNHFYSILKQNSI